jgi:hypothetical protein
MMFLHNHLIYDLVGLTAHRALCLEFASPVNLVNHGASIATPLVFINLNFRRLRLFNKLRLWLTAHSTFQKFYQAVVMVPTGTLPLAFVKPVPVCIYFKLNFSLSFY